MSRLAIPVELAIHLMKEKKLRADPKKKHPKLTQDEKDQIIQGLHLGYYLPKRDRLLNEDRSLWPQSHLEAGYPQLPETSLPTVPGARH